MGLLIRLLMAHAIADFGLQPKFMVVAKNRHRKQYLLPWYYWLVGHSLICGGVLYLFTNRLDLAILEIIIHGVIDWLKCEKRLTPEEDQGCHLITKLLYVLT